MSTWCRCSTSIDVDYSLLSGDERELESKMTMANCCIEMGSCSSCSGGATRSGEVPRWWRSDTTLPGWYTSEPRSPCMRYFPAYMTMFSIACHTAGFFLMYGSELDPLTNVPFLVYQACLLGSFTCVLIISCIDPGIVRPRMDLVLRNGGTDEAIARTQKHLEKELCVHDPSAEVLDTPWQRTVATLAQTINGVDCKWCYTCKIWRTPGVVHCSECGFCMQGYDHHCGVMGMCIAKRNVRFFTLMFLFGGMAAIALFIGAVMHAVELSHHYPWHNWNWYFTLIGCFYPIPAGLGLFGPGCNYVLMGFQGVTVDSIHTQQLKQRQGYDAVDDDARKPSSCLRNACRFWCSSIGWGFHRNRHPLGENKGYYICQ
eukprot:m.84806 g.84806  ORF g.84806 m.84806 type:complete len:372 (-) comp25804_c0_seq2:24-1139(-)